MISVVVEHGVEAIMLHAFSNCTNLVRAELPSSVTSIAENEFSGCTGLESLDLSRCASLNSIGDEAFQGCANLTSLVFNVSAPTLGERAFADTASGPCHLYPKQRRRI